MHQCGTLAPPVCGWTSTRDVPGGRPLAPDFSNHPRPSHYAFGIPRCRHFGVEEALVHVWRARGGAREDCERGSAIFGLFFGRSLVRQRFEDSELTSLGHEPESV